MKIVVYTLGCKVNQYESDALTNMLRIRGHEVSDKLEIADVYILNTCAVTNEAEKKSRQMLAKFKKLNNKAKIFVCGCASQHNAKQFLTEKNVVYVCGTGYKAEIVESLDKTNVKLRTIPKIYDENLVANYSSTNRAYIKIQDGCNNFCSYCLIPYVRGRSRSRNLFSILEEINVLKENAKEIVITGIDISDYRIDGKLAICELVRQLAGFPVRFRFGSLEVRMITDEFVNEVKQAKNICPHFHLSLQSGSDSVLKKMNRKYTTQQYYEAVKKLREVFDNPAITTDIIVGFPEETEEEFEQTYEFAKKVGFAKIHIFPYSKREGTVASYMKMVNPQTKKQRVEKLTLLEQELHKRYINSCKHKKFNLIVEETEDKYFVGTTENYIKCYTKGKLELNGMYRVKIIKPYKDGAIAKVVKK